MAATITSDGVISWELREGDFLDLIEHEPHTANLVFFDPYSPKKNQDMWTTACFEKIRKKSRSPEQGGTLLYTYSLATRIRVAMMKGGFFVGRGMATGLKDETTEASTYFHQLKSPLGKIWYDRWSKSHLRYPFDCQPQDEAQIDQFVREHMQVCEKLSL